VDPHAVIGSPLGCLRIDGTEDAVATVRFLTASPSRPTRGRGAPAEAARQLTAYFERRLQRFDVPLAPEGTTFQREVWTALLEIPYGVAWSYGQLAARLGRRGSSRAVGAANGANPIAVIVPCHRVIGSDGSLTGYGGGVERKRALLELEGIRRGSHPSGYVPLQRSLF